MKKYFIIVLVLSLLTACIPTKKLTYFQGEPSEKTDIYQLNSEPYRLQVNDILLINIKSENIELTSLFSSGTAQSGGDNSGYTIDRHGNIRIPILGYINVLGYTEREVREKIEIELGAYFKNLESIFVTVKIAGINFTITGEISSPGTKNIAKNEVSIIEAIANSGDATIYGDRENVEIIRKTLDGVKKFKVNLLSIDVFESENFYIKPNDIIYIAPLKRKSWGTGTTGLQSFTTMVTIFSFVVSTVLLVKSL